MSDYLKQIAKLLAEAEYLISQVERLLAHKKAGQANNELAAEMNEWLQKMGDFWNT